MPAVSYALATSENPPARTVVLTSFSLDRLTGDVKTDIMVCVLDAGGVPKEGAREYQKTDTFATLPEPFKTELDTYLKSQIDETIV